MSSCYFSSSSVAFILVGLSWRALTHLTRVACAFFIPECHISGRSNAFDFQWSQKEVKRFCDASGTEATPFFQTHTSPSWWRTLCLSPISITHQWCKPAGLNQTPKLLQPSTPILCSLFALCCCTIGHTKQVTLLLSYSIIPIFSPTHDIFLPQTTTLSIAIC